ncbi:anaphase-promoting complex subunit 7 [Lepeophtheirus salmonis]|uniref:Anaphasepromoting complex subunit 7like [Bombus impatiens] n=1 Tax=Lepeophtheirus salmonis TaxID=72036 RepID=A0A0K2US80_LEPSM
MALGQLYYHAGMERPAIACYKEVLKACPLAIEAAQILMHLGVKAKEINSLTLDLNGSSHNGLDWYGQWVQASAQSANRDYKNAISMFKSIEENYHPFRDNVSLLVEMGKAQFYNGDFTGAMLTLSRAHKIEPFHLQGMDILASLLATDKKTKELEVFSKKLLSVSEDLPEPWTAMGYYSYLNKKSHRAVYFAHKACMIQSRSIEALLLKGNLLLDLKKVQDAMNHFREAIQLAPYRFECHKGLVECYLGQSRYREAVTLAAAANLQLNRSARSLTLYASVVMNDPLQISISKPKQLLERALEADPCYLPAVYLLAELLEQEMNFDEAITLLRKQLTLQTTCKLHQMLADLLAKTNEEEKAMEHYGIALNLDPKNLPAQEGLQKIEQSTDTPLDTTYDLEMEEINADDHELEESEAEAVWSDGDLNLTSGPSARGLN